MMLRSALVATAACLVEGIQQQIQREVGPFGSPDTRKKCKDYCKKVGCPKGSGCCTNQKKMKITRQFKNPTVKNADACFNQKNIWCSQGGWTFKNSKSTCIPFDTNAGGDPFNCLTREQCSDEKKDWCCENKQLGCTTTDAPTTADVGAVADPHITNVEGQKFDLFKGGQHTLLTIPEGASHEDADLEILGQVRKQGSRDNDLWIRKLAISGKWVEGGPVKFKTLAGPFNSADSLLVRPQGENWRQLDGFSATNLVLTSDLDKSGPTEDFAQSVARKVELSAGPLKILVDYATSQKEGQGVNHLDLHVQGLDGVDSASGLLAASRNM